MFSPIDMRFVPVRAAFSAMTRAGARRTGGFGAGGAVEARLEEDIAMAPLLEDIGAGSASFVSSAVNERVVGWETCRCSKRKSERYHKRQLDATYI